MGRAKLRLEMISNEKKRHSTFEKRRKGLEKKATELSTLCGVKIAMILYGHEKEPVVWPGNQDENDDVSFLIESYKSGHDRKSCRTYSLSTFFKDQTEKIEEELEKVSKMRKELVKYPNWDERYNSLSQEQLKEFAGILSRKIEAGKEMINLIKDSKKINSGTELMNPPNSVQENTIFMPSSSNMQCNSDMLQDMIQWQQPMKVGISNSVVQMMQSPYTVKDLENFNFSTEMMNNSAPSVQENTILMPSSSTNMQYYCNSDHDMLQDMIQWQQQPNFPYNFDFDFDAQNTVKDLKTNNFSIELMNNSTSSVQEEKAIFMPTSWSTNNMQYNCNSSDHDMLMLLQDHIIQWQEEEQPNLPYNNFDFDFDFDFDAAQSSSGTDHHHVIMPLKTAEGLEMDDDDDANEYCWNWAFNVLTS